MQSLCENMLQNLLMHTILRQIHESHQHLGFQRKVCGQKNGYSIVQSLSAHQLNCSKVKNCRSFGLGLFCMNQASEICEKIRETSF